MEKEAHDNEPIILRNDSIGRSKSKYDDPEIYEYLVEKRNDGWTFEKICEGLKERGYDKIDPNTVSKLYTKAVAKSITLHHTANERFTDMSEELDQMNAQAMRALRKLLDYINNIGDELEETQDLSTLQKQLKFVQLAPQIKMALSELRETIKDYYNHQDKVIKEKESQSMTLQEMINNLSTYMVPVLKEWEKQKKIEILDRNLIKNI
jgi:hypothetical protein